MSEYSGAILDHSDRVGTIVERIVGASQMGIEFSTFD